MPPNTSTAPAIQGSSLSPLDKAGELLAELTHASRVSGMDSEVNRPACAQGDARSGGDRTPRDLPHPRGLTGVALFPGERLTRLCPEPGGKPPYLPPESPQP